MAKWRFRLGFASPKDVMSSWRWRLHPGGGSKWNLNWRNSGSGRSWGVDVFSSRNWELQYIAVWMVLGHGNGLPPSMINILLNQTWNLKKCMFCLKRNLFFNGVHFTGSNVHFSMLFFWRNGFKYSKDRLFGDTAALNDHNMKRVRVHSLPLEN